MSAIVFAPRLPARLAFGGLLRSEAIKLRSLRSIRAGLAAVLVLELAGALLRAVVYTGSQGYLGSSVDGWRSVIQTAFTGGSLGALVLVALLGGTEYTSRSIVTSFVAAPRRLGVLAAKGIVCVVAVAVTGAVGDVLGILVALPSMHAARFAPPTSDLVGFCLAGIAQLAMIAAVLLPIAVLTRSTAGALTFGFVVLFVLPIPLLYVSGFLHLDLERLLLPNIAAVVASALHAPGVTPQFWSALPVAVLWVAVPWVAAAIATVRRDA